MSLISWWNYKGASGCGLYCHCHASCKRGLQWRSPCRFLSLGPKRLWSASIFFVLLHSIHTFDSRLWVDLTALMDEMKLLHSNQFWLMAVGMIQFIGIVVFAVVVIALNRKKLLDKTRFVLSIRCH
jgi:hypothetical protein